MIPMHMGLDAPIEVLNGTAPAYLVYTFTIINGLISFSYGLLAFYFARRIKLPTGKRDRNPLVFLAMFGAILFFVGCAHTHLDLALWSGSGELAKHWYSWGNVFSHVLQGIGGLTFWVLATFFLQFNIYDKRHYNRTINSEMEKPWDGVERRKNQLPPPASDVDERPDSGEQ